MTEILCKREQRYFATQLIFSFERKRIILAETEVTRGLVGHYVETYAYADGRLDVALERIFPTLYRVRQDAVITEKVPFTSKRIGSCLNDVEIGRPAQANAKKSGGRNLNQYLLTIKH